MQKRQNLPRTFLGRFTKVPPFFSAELSRFSAGLSTFANASPSGLGRFTAVIAPEPKIGRKAEIQLPTKSPKATSYEQSLERLQTAIPDACCCTQGQNVISIINDFQYFVRDNKQ